MLFIVWECCFFPLLCLSSAVFVIVAVMLYRLQWHLCPLDPRNNDLAFLQRCGIDAVDASGERRPPELDEDAELYSVLITGVRKEIMETRHAVWQFVQHRLSTLFFGIAEKQGSGVQVRVV